MQTNIDKELRELILAKVLQKKELAHLSKDFTKQQLEKYISENLKTYRKFKEKYNSSKEKIEKSKQLKTIIKEVRAKLRAVFGVFYNTGFENVTKLINKITSENADIICFDILKLHKSSDERLRNYEEIYDNINAIIKIKPQKILDLACGFNPFSYFFIEESFGCKPEYICCDISNKDIDNINLFFKKIKISGTAFICDLSNQYEQLKDISCDICFLFKTLDSLETNKKNVSEQVLQNINSKYVVVSFPSISIGNKKKIPKERRAWFYNLIEKLNYTYSEFEIHNELFIVIEK